MHWIPALFGFLFSPRSLLVCGYLACFFFLFYTRVNAAIRTFPTMILLDGRWDMIWLARIWRKE